MAATIKTLPNSPAWRNERPSSLSVLDDLINRFWKKIPNENSYGQNSNIEIIKLIRAKITECEDICQNPQLDPEVRKHYERLRKRCTGYLITLEPYNYPTLYDRLDITIELYEQCNAIKDSGLNGKELTEEEVKCIIELRTRCEHFIGIIADDLDINAKEIKNIKEKRKIDPTYLPKHLPSYLSEPVYSKDNVDEFSNFEALYRKHLLKIKFKEELHTLQKNLGLYSQFTKKIADIIADINENSEENENSDESAIKTKRLQSRIEHLQSRREHCRRLIGSSLGNPSITNEEIVEIQAQRKTERDYLWELFLEYLKRTKNIVELQEEVDTQDVLRFIFKKQRLKEILKETSPDNPNRKLLNVRREYVRKEVRTNALFGGSAPSYPPDKALSQAYKVISESYKTRKKLLVKNPPPEEVKKKLIPWNKETIEKFTTEEKEALNIIKYFDQRFPREGNYLDLEDNSNLLNRYLDPAQRELYRIIIHNGKFYRLVEKRDGLKAVPFDSSNFRSHSKTGWVSFIMTPKGELFASSHIRGGHFLHSSFVKGSWVFFSGEMSFVNGTVTGICDYSGHYQPEELHMNNFINHLAKKKVNLSSCAIYQQDYARIQAKKDKIKQKYSNDEDEYDKRMQKLHTAIEKFNYSNLYKYKGKLQLSKPQSLLKSFGYVSSSGLFFIGIALITVSSILSFGTVPIAVGVGMAIFSAVSFFAIKFNWYEKIKSFFKNKKQLIHEQIIHEIKPVPAKETHALTIEKLNHAEISHQPDPLDPKYSHEDRRFSRKWSNLAGYMTDYPEWNNFIVYIRTNINAGNYALTNEMLSKDLDKLLSVFYDSSLTCRKKMPNGKNNIPLPEAVNIWKHEENFKKLFLEIACEHKDDLEKLKKIENDVFKPVLATVEKFVNKITDFPLTASKTMLGYEKLKQTELSKIYKTEEDCKPVSVMGEETEVGPSKLNLNETTDSSIQLHL